MKTKFKFGPQTVLGLGVGIFCVFFGIIESSSFMAFVNVPSFLITIGGTIGAMIVTYPFEVLRTFGSVMLKVFSKDNNDPAQDINTFVEISEIVRKEGILAIEERIEAMNDNPFMQKGLRMLVDGFTTDNIRGEMIVELSSMKRRHKDGAAMLAMIAKTTPSLGLLCTYVGLIPMLQNLSNPETLGPMMAIELVSSFYGSFIAYVLFAPMASRLALLSKKESSRKEMIINGVSALSEGLSPSRIEMRLKNFLSEKELRGSKKKIKGVSPSAEEGETE